MAGASRIGEAYQGWIAWNAIYSQHLTGYPKWTRNKVEGWETVISTMPEKSVLEEGRQTWLQEEYNQLAGISEPRMENGQQRFKSLPKQAR